LTPSKSVPKTHFDLWTGRKPSMRHMHVWVCPTEAQVYNPHKRKNMDSRTVNGYFIGFPVKSKGYRFYCPNHTSRIVKTYNAKFLEKGEVSRSVKNQVVDINDIKGDDPSPMNVHKSVTTPDVVPAFQKQEQHLNNEQTSHEENNLPTQTSELVGISLRKPARVRKSAIPYDYIVYLQETDFDIGIDNDPIFFFTSRESDKFEMWINAMKEELKSMAENKV
nr:retrovirus-related Pol polyprotein from transposon TNT 1-94 [Tanacetum cinerariifolium]